MAWVGLGLYCIIRAHAPHRQTYIGSLDPAKQVQESPSDLALDCLCQTGLTPWSVNLPFHRINLLFMLLCKIIFPGPVGALGQASWSFFVLLNCLLNCGQKLAQKL